MKTARFTLSAFSLAAVFALSSCALITPPEAPRETFDISAPTSFGGLPRGTRSQILIKEPTSLKTIDSERIVLRPQPAVITVLAGAQWADSAPKLLQARLVEAFENTGRTGATAKPGDGLVIDYQLVSDLRRFDVDGRSNQAVIEISVKLLSDKSGQVLETRIFKASATPASDAPQDYVEAFDAAFDDLARSIIAWVLSNV